MQSSYLREGFEANGNSLISKDKGHPVTCHDWQKKDVEADLLTLKLCHIEMGSQHHAPVALAPGRTPGTHCTGGRVRSSAAGMDGCGADLLLPPGL